ncbi:MAG: 6-phosphogluconolactonase [Thermodesulfobacteriota bacterium]
MDKRVGPNAPEIIICKDGLELYSRAVAAFIDLSQKSQDKKGRFNVALSGGSTPLPLYGLLASEVLRERVRWSGVHFFWSDERSVPPDSKESNYGMAARNLLHRLEIDEDNIHRIKGELGASAAPAYERELRRAFGLGAGEFPVFDLLILGMGVDGHTASLFPGSAALCEEKKMVTAEYVEKLASTRITFTPPLIQRASNIIFLVRGGDKAAALKAVLRGPLNESDYPASLTRLGAGRVRWFIDNEAALMLPVALEP